MSDLIGLIKGLILSQVKTKITDPVPFSVFFEGGLKFSRTDAADLGWYYLASAKLVDNPPGLGVAEASPGASGISAATGPTDRGQVIVMPGADKFKASLAAANVGVVTKGILEDSIELRLSAWLRKYATPNSAAKALSPAKRDALAAEARKLMARDLWETTVFRSQYSSVGVRG